MNAETRPERTPLRPLTASDDPLGVYVPADDSVSVSDLQDIRDIRIEREKKINGGRGRPSARTLRLRAERAREGAYYLSPSADPDRLPVWYAPATAVAHGCSTPTTKNAESSNALPGDDELGAVRNQLNRKSVTGVGSADHHEQSPSRNLHHDEPES